MSRKSKQKTWKTKQKKNINFCLDFWVFCLEETQTTSLTSTFSERQMSATVLEGEEDHAHFITSTLEN
jgi:hypothetical protein